jgi:hypothetical protein
LSSSEWLEVEKLASGLVQALSDWPDVQFSVSVQGCGATSGTFLDGTSGVRLFEIKSVQRAFRAGDVRQALIYTALMHLGGTNVTTVRFINPRRGRSSTMSLTDLASSSAGVGVKELLNAIEGLMLGIQISV